MTFCLQTHYQNLLTGADRFQVVGTAWKHAETLRLFCLETLDSQMAAVECAMEDTGEQGFLVSVRVQLTLLIAPGLWKVREVLGAVDSSVLDDDQVLRLMLSHYPLSVSRGQGIRRGSVLDIYGCHVLPPSFSSKFVTLVCCAYSHISIVAFGTSDLPITCPPPVPAEIGGTENPPLAYLPFDAACWLYGVYELMQSNFSSTHFENSLWKRRVPFSVTLNYFDVARAYLGESLMSCN